MNLRVTPSFNTQNNKQNVNFGAFKGRKEAIELLHLLTSKTPTELTLLDSVKAGDLFLGTANLADYDGLIKARKRYPNRLFTLQEMTQLSGVPLEERLKIMVQLAKDATPVRVADVRELAKARGVDSKRAALYGATEGLVEDLKPNTKA